VREDKKMKTSLLCDGISLVLLVFVVFYMVVKRITS
jgi:hypothetical protein